MLNLVHARTEGPVSADPAFRSVCSMTKAAIRRKSFKVGSVREADLGPARSECLLSGIGRADGSEREPPQAWPLGVSNGLGNKLYG